MVRHWQRNGLRRGTFETLEPRQLLAVDHVIHISVDGLGSRWLEPLMAESGDSPFLPNFQRLVREGTSTTNARTDYSLTNTLPNHASMLTGRPVLAPRGQSTAVHHNWTSNSDPPAGVTLHSNHPQVDYVASVFDVVHDRGGTTALFTGKSKFSLFDVSYDAAHGAADADATGGDNGPDKIDTFVLQSDSRQLVDRYLQDLSNQQFTYSLLHLVDPDAAGHGSGWGSESWNTAVQRIDGYLGQLLQTIETTNLQGKTAILLTADHGGRQSGHGDPGQADNYRIPLFLWGATVPGGGDVYEVFSAALKDPGNSRPDYNAFPAPARNGDSANVALGLLGFPAVPDSWLTPLHDCFSSSAVGCRTDVTPPPDYDYGDAPLPYPTAAAASGARHKIEAGFHLGASIDQEYDGQPDLSATGDDLRGDDEDGVILVSPLRPGETASLQVTASQPGLLQAWIDWNRDGNWSDPTEHILRDVSLAGGASSLSIDVPAESEPGTVFARFRFSRQSGLSWSGSADAGEVEDYAFHVEQPVQIEPIVARDDTFRVPAGTRDLTLYVLANDQGQGLVTVRSVGPPDQSGQVQVHGDRTALRYSPRPGFIGQESFVYEIQDALGRRASARVTIQVEAPKVEQGRVRLRMEVVGPTQDSVSQLRIGDPFTLNVYVQDARPSGTGVAAAYVDLSYAAQFVTATGTIRHAENYRQQTSGQVQIGQIDEVGGRSTNTMTGADEQLLFQVDFRAIRKGSVVFAIEPADEPTHVIQLEGGAEPIPADRWLFDSLTVNVAPLQHEVQPEDVNEDGFVTALDALLIINDLNRHGARSLADSEHRPRHLVDVDGDGYASAVDALLVINWLNDPPSTPDPIAEAEANVWTERSELEPPLDDQILAMIALTRDPLKSKRASL